MSNDDSAIAMDMAGALTGQNYVIDCPSCKRKTLSACKKADGAIVYHCWRASCGTAGRVNGIATLAALEREPVGEEPLNFYKGSYLPLERTQQAEIASRFRLPTYEHVRDFRLSEDGRIIMPILAPSGKIRGLVVRVRWTGVLPHHVAPSRVMPLGGFPKSQIFKEAYEPMQSWYVGDTDGEVIAVEDQMSAIKLAQLGYNAVALLGTELNAEKVAEIQQQADYVTLALDGDATGKAFKMVRKWGQAFVGARVAVLGDRDIKDLSEDEIHAIFG